MIINNSNLIFILFDDDVVNFGNDYLQFKLTPDNYSIVRDTIKNENKYFRNMNNDIVFIAPYSRLEMTIKLFGHSNIERNNHGTIENVSMIEFLKKVEYTYNRKWIFFRGDENYTYKTAPNLYNQVVLFINHKKPNMFKDEFYLEIISMDNYISNITYRYCGMGYCGMDLCGE